MGETPCAFIELIEGQTVEEDELKKFCREHLAGFKMPKTFVSGPTKHQLVKFKSTS